VHVGLLPGLEGLDVRRLTLQEITFTGSYCYTHDEFVEVVDAMARGLLGRLDWYVSRPLSDAAQAFSDLDSGHCASPKVVLRP
jgi:threonine dehydrogenase-like Zn-dependent dehydrogenase